MWKHKRLMQANPDDGAGGGGGAPPAANAAWFPDAHKSLVEGKGWKAPADALDSYVNLEKLFGADKAGRTVVLPKDDKDVEGLKAFHSKIGVPESADKYELPLPEGDDGAFAKTVAGWFHQHGVPKTAAQGITKAWNEHIGKMVKEQEAAELAASKQAADEVRASWGADATKNEELARRAFKQLIGDKLDTYERALGTAEFLRLGALLGQKIAEPGPAGDSGGGGSFSVSKPAAQARLDQIRDQRAKGEISDQAWKALQPEWEKLSQIVAAS